MLEEILRGGFAELGLEPDVRAEERYRIYYENLEETNKVMNLTAITDDEGVAEKHFADSLLPLTMVQLPVGASLVDVGSGAGFPGRGSTAPAKAAHLFSAAYADAGGPSRDPPRQSRGCRAG